LVESSRTVEKLSPFPVAASVTRPTITPKEDDVLGALA
jgi:hypothetical protein